MSDAISSPPHSPVVVAMQEVQENNIDLTPKSKVQAMLAAIDDDDDQDSSEKENNAPFQPRFHSKVSDGKSSANVRSNSYPNYDGQKSKDVEHTGQTYEWLDSSVSPGATSAENEGYSNRETFIQHAIESQYPPRSFTNSRNNTAAETPVESDDNDDLGSLADSEQTPRRKRIRRGSIQPTKSPVAQPDSPRSASLFVSPQQSRRLPLEQQTHDEIVQRPSHSPKARLKALAARKREEIRQLGTRDDLSSGTDDSTPSSRANREQTQIPTIVAEPETADNRVDRDTAKRLTQQARPTRKASKKALEEMNRETQRMSRNMQLTHEARTKTKFTTEAFLAKFNYGQSNTDAAARSFKPANPLSSSATTSSDAEAPADENTPPSSPPSIDDQSAESRVVPSHSTYPAFGIESPGRCDVEVEEELLDLKQLLSQKSAFAAIKESKVEINAKQQEEPVIASKRYSVKRFAKSVKPARLTATSDDELEIIDSTKLKTFRVFESLPKAKAQEAKPLHHLRLLAHISTNNYGKRGNNKSISAAELESSLRQRARKQAKDERNNKIQKLKDRGVIVMTAEEKEREQMQLDTMLEKARKEARDLAKREKEAAKKDGNVVGDDLPDSDDEDEDYVSVEDGEEEDNSGSEEEGTDEDEQTIGGLHIETEQEEMVDSRKENLLVAEEAVESLSDNVSSEDLSDNEDPSEHLATAEDSLAQPKRQSRKRVILSDDEEDEQPVQKASATDQIPLSNPKTPKQAAADIFGFTKTESPALHLSQVFAGTMAESQTQDISNEDFDEDQDSLAFLRGLPPPDLPDFTTPRKQVSPSERVTDSQQKDEGSLSETPHSVLVRFDTATQGELDETQTFEIPDLSQDVGFQTLDSQTPLLAASYSTVDTIPIQISPQKRHDLAPRKGRLLRKGSLSLEKEALQNDDNDPDSFTKDEHADNPSNVFDVMQKAAKVSHFEQDFNKKNSEAKGMVEDQAEESEDEYAGLGGASDDDSDSAANEDMNNIIDDEDKAATDERDIASYFAERERLDDEKEVEKLYKDVINGGFRRKRGAEHDLWESDDEDEIAARRRAVKQREFARMRKALLADEKLGKIAQNPKQEAFLQTIEDRTSSEDHYLLDDPNEELSQIPDSQGATATANQEPDAQLENTSKRKLGEMEQTEDPESKKARLPPSLRRTGTRPRPTTLAEVRNTLSEIIGEPESFLEETETIFASPTNSEHEDDELGWIDSDVNGYTDDIYDSPADMPPPPKPNISQNPRRTGANPARAAVVDRMALKRSGSSSSNSLNSAGNKLAFQALGRSNSTGSRVPSLLRRATTNGSMASSNSSETSHSSSTGAGYGGLGGKENIKMGGSKKSSINYHVREQERRAKVEQVERERKEGRERVGKLRRTTVISGFGTLVGGNFE